LGNHDIGNTETSVGEWGVDALGGQSILSGSTNYIGVDERDNTSESHSGWKSWVAADGWDLDVEWVEVLLSCHEALGSCKSISAGSKLGDNLIGLLELGARVGGGEEIADGGSSKSGCYT
jgi:hypothetical protein